MTQLTRPDGAVIYYEVTGSGPPILALGSGGAVSGIDRWQCEPIHPVEAFSGDFTVIVMDQRYAGRSRAPLTPFSHQQALGDQLAVLDTEGATNAHVIGAGVGCSHALRLSYEAPARVASLVLLNPVGIDESNTMDTFYDLFRDTIRVARADGLSGVVAAAMDNPSFIANPAGGPWAQRLHDEADFRDTLLSLGRETYIALIVDFRDGLWPWNQSCFSINDVALTRINVP
ncbi:MAG: alpha/beta hydrolase, partial [Gammaproteobacteria bacterium]|nr:alpha/beta hydrolase [Gammaproteobacteria bacterium]